MSFSVKSTHQYVGETQPTEESKDINYLLKKYNAKLSKTDGKSKSSVIYSTAEKVVTAGSKGSNQGMAIRSTDTAQSDFY